MSKPLQGYRLGPLRSLRALMCCSGPRQRRQHQLFAQQTIAIDAAPPPWQLHHKPLGGCATPTMPSGRRNTTLSLRPRPSPTTHSLRCTRHPIDCCRQGSCRANTVGLHDTMHAVFRILFSTLLPHFGVLVCGTLLFTRHARLLLYRSTLR